MADEPQAARNLDAQALFEEGQRALKGDDLDRAEQIFEFLLTHDRDHVVILFHLATCWMKRGRDALAENLYRRCLELEPNFPECWNNIGFICDKEARREDAMEAFDKALAMRPESSEFINNVATQWVNNATPETAIEWCEKALALDERNPDAHWNRGLAYLELGRWKEGWDEYEWGLHGEMGTGKRKDKNYALDRTLPWWEGTAGKKVAVFGEQGVGDEIMFASMLPDVIERAGAVYYDAHPRLVNLMRRSFPGIEVYGTRKNHEAPWPRRREIDARIAIGSLGRLFRTHDEDFPREPYLKPHPDLVEKWRARLAALGPRPKIGFSWKGGTKITRKDLRSIPLADCLPVLSQDADFISLQYDSLAPHQIAEFEAEHGIKIHHWQSCIDDLDESYGGLMPALDLTITVAQSAMHAAGAMGLECWVLMPRRRSWQMGRPQADYPWYPLRQFGQGDTDDWSDVIQRVAYELGAFLAQKEAA